MTADSPIEEAETETGSELANRAVEARRANWKRYSQIMAGISTAYALAVAAAFWLAPDLVVPLAIGGGLAIGIVSSLLARRTSHRDPFSEH